MVDLDFNASSIDIPAAFEAFGTLQHFAPIARKAVGKVSLGMKYTSYLDDHMMPRLNSVIAKGNFTSNVIGLKNATMFDKIGSALNTKAFDNLTLNNLDVKFDIRDGRLLVSPFETKLGKTTFLVGGDQGIDQTMIILLASAYPVTAAAAAVSINSLIGKANEAIEADPMKTRIWGQGRRDFHDPKVGLTWQRTPGRLRRK
jgi:hypothetical protein